MSLVSRTISSMFNGVSQQAPSVRHENQCEEADNARSTVVRGVGKRAPFEHISQALSEANKAGSNALVHFIHRDGAEKYAVIFQTDQTIDVFDLTDGTQRTVTYSPGTQSYLPTNPKANLAVVSVADYTFIVNKSRTVTAGSTTATGTTGDAYSSLAAINDSTNGIVPPDNLVHEITGDGSGVGESFWIKGDTKTWREVAKPGVTIDFDAADMPHGLVRNGDGTFTLNELSWDTRKAGDDATNKRPSFVGKKISDVFFHRNRLGFLSDENIIFSEVGEYFNFWRTTVVQVLDSDRIDTTATHTKVSLLKHAVPYDKSLYLFSPQAQFVHAGGEALTPRTGDISQTTEYEMDVDVRPVNTGTSILFSSPSGDHTAIREYYVEEDTAANQAANITAHVPKYLPKNIFQLASSNSYDVAFAISSDTPNVIYVYQHYWKGNEKIQSAWSKWTLASDIDVKGLDCMGNYLYMVYNRTGHGTHIAKLNLEEFTTTADMGFQIHLDFLTEVENTNMSYSVIDDKTTISLPYDIDLAGDLRVVLSDDHTGQVGVLLDPSTYERPQTYEVVVPGDITAGSVFVGVPYEFQYEFSQQFMRSQKGTILDGDLRLRTMSVSYQDTSYFTAKVLPLGRSEQYTTQTHTIETQYTGKTVGASALILGQPSFEDGVLRFPVFSDAKTVRIILTNDSHLGCYFDKAEWMGNFTKRSRTVG